MSLGWELDPCPSYHFGACSGRLGIALAGEGIEWVIVLPVIGSFMLVGIAATFFFKEAQFVSEPRSCGKQWWSLSKNLLPAISGVALP